MTWTSIISADMFDGPRGDLLIAVSGILSLALIVVALGAIWRVFR